MAQTPSKHLNENSRIPFAAASILLAQRVMRPVFPAAGMRTTATVCVVGGKFARCRWREVIPGPQRFNGQHRYADAPAPAKVAAWIFEEPA
jgi:hypothetical protein